MAYSYLYYRAPKVYTDSDLSKILQSTSAAKAKAKSKLNKNLVSIDEKTYNSMQPVVNKLQDDMLKAQSNYLSQEGTSTNDVEFKTLTTNYKTAIETFANHLVKEAADVTTFNDGLNDGTVDLSAFKRVPQGANVNDFETLLKMYPNQNEVAGFYFGNQNVMTSGDFDIYDGKNKRRLKPYKVDDIIVGYYDKRTGNFVDKTGENLVNSYSEKIGLDGNHVSIDSNMYQFEQYFNNWDNFSKKDTKNDFGVDLSKGVVTYKGQSIYDMNEFNFDETLMETDKESNNLDSITDKIISNTGTVNKDKKGNFKPEFKNLLDTEIYGENSVFIPSADGQTWKNDAAKDLIREQINKNSLLGNLNSEYVESILKNPFDSNGVILPVVEQAITNVQKTVYDTVIERQRKQSSNNIILNNSAREKTQYLYINEVGDFNQTESIQNLKNNTGEEYIGTSTNTQLLDTSYTKKAIDIKAHKYNKDGGVNNWEDVNMIFPLQNQVDLTKISNYQINVNSDSFTFIYVNSENGQLLREDEIGKVPAHVVPVFIGSAKLTNSIGESGFNNAINNATAENDNELVQLLESFESLMAETGSADNRKVYIPIRPPFIESSQTKNKTSYPSLMEERDKLQKAYDDSLGQEEKEKPEVNW